MAPGSQTTSFSSVTSSSLSAPNTPFATTALRQAHAHGTASAARRQVVSAPVTFSACTSSSGGQSIRGRKLSLGSSSSTSSNEIVMFESAQAAQRKRKRATTSTGSSPSARGFHLSFRNVYATTDRNGRARIGSGSGTPAGCSVM